MTILQFVGILGIVLGFVAAIYFCVGSAELRAARIRELSGTYWDNNPHALSFFVSLKSDYLCGGLALVLSFVCQFLAAVPGQIPSTQLFQNPGTGAFLAAVSGAAVGWLLWIYRSWVISKLHEEINKPKGTTDSPN